MRRWAAARRRWRPRTLRAQLTTALVLLVLLVGLLTSAVTTVSLRGFLIDRLDAQLASAGGRFSAELEHGGGGDRSDAGTGDLDGAGRGQTVGTLGARIAGGAVTQAAVAEGDGTTEDLTLDQEQAAVLESLDPGAGTRSVDLGALGNYRVQAVTGRDGDVQVTGLSLRDVHATVARLALLEALLTAAAALVCGVGSAVAVRSALHPLRRVAETARRVSQLPLTTPGTPLPERTALARPVSEADEVSAAFDRMLDHVRVALAARDEEQELLRRFVADASHELRTPLATIRAHAEYVTQAGEALPADARRSVARISSAAVRMGALVDDLLLLARLDAGRPLAQDPVDLTALVLEAVFDEQASSTDHHWRLDLPDDFVTTTGDGPRLHQVVANLLANARRHTPAGTTVTTTLHSGDRETDLVVSDDGPGIDPALQQTLFDRFSRGDPSRATVSGGAGLGLSIARGIVEAHGGTLVLEPAQVGARFHVKLPRADVPFSAVRPGPRTLSGGTRQVPGASTW